MLWQSWHSVPMTRLSTRFIVDAREDFIAILNSQITECSAKNKTMWFHPMNKRNDCESTFNFLKQRQKRKKHIYVLINIIPDVCAGCDARFRTVRVSGCENGSWHFEYVGCRPDMQNNRPARPALHEETTPLHFPAMPDNDSVSSEPSKHNFKKFW